MNQEHPSNLQATLKTTVESQGQKVTWKMLLEIAKVSIIRSNNGKVRVHSTQYVEMKKSIQTKKFKKLIQVNLSTKIMNNKTSFYLL